MWFKTLDKDKEKGCRRFDNGARGRLLAVHCAVVFCFKCTLMLINWLLMFFCRWLEMHRQTCLRRSFTSGVLQCKCLQNVSESSETVQTSMERGTVTRTKWVWKMQCKHKQRGQGRAAGWGQTQEIRTWKGKVEPKTSPPWRGPRLRRGHGNKVKQQGRPTVRASPQQWVASVSPHHTACKPCGAHTGWVIDHYLFLGLFPYLIFKLKFFEVQENHF